MTIFLLLSFTDVPLAVLILCYTGVLCISLCVVPLLSAIAMNYIHRGAALNFGFSRGMGSISYAITAIFLGRFLEYFSPDILSVIFALGSVGFLPVAHSLPEQKGICQTRKRASSLFSVIKNHKILFVILLGYSFDFAGTTTLATYLINIVKSLGGDTAIYGVAVFIMALCEMPAMALTQKLMKKYTTMHLVMAVGIGAMVGNVLGGMLQDSFGISAMLRFVIVLTVAGSSILIFTGLYYGTNKEILEK